MVKQQYTKVIKASLQKAECRWKKNKLQVSFEILQKSLIKYQKVVEAVKSNCRRNIPELKQTQNAVKYCNVITNARRH